MADSGKNRRKDTETLDDNRTTRHRAGRPEAAEGDAARSPEHPDAGGKAEKVSDESVTPASSRQSQRKLSFEEACREFGVTGYHRTIIRVRLTENGTLAERRSAAAWKRLFSE